MVHKVYNTFGSIRMKKRGMSNGVYRHVWRKRKLCGNKFKENQEELMVSMAIFGGNEN